MNQQRSELVKDLKTFSPRGTPSPQAADLAIEVLIRGLGFLRLWDYAGYHVFWR